MLTTIIFFSVMAFITAVIFGINISASIDDPILYMLFWLMYFITIATVIAIGLTIYHITLLQPKNGTRGTPGPRGEPGTPGVKGNCASGCRTDGHVESILNHLVKTINNLEIREGRTGDIVPTDIKNMYIRTKIDSMVQSPEFKQLATFKGEEALVTYIKTVWEDIITRIYRGGGINYIKSIGAEMDWDWVSENPWDEFKKYDIYYWGLGQEYRPVLIDSTATSNGSTVNDGGYILPDKKDQKYSVLAYINVPGESNLMKFIPAINKKTQRRIKLINAYTLKPDPAIIQKYKPDDKSGQPLNISPMSFLINSSSHMGGTCYKLSDSLNMLPKPCDPYDSGQIFEIEFNSKTPAEFKIKNKATGTYVENTKSSQVLRKSNTGDTYKFV